MFANPRPQLSPFSFYKMECYPDPARMTKLVHLNISSSQRASFYFSQGQDHLHSNICSLYTMAALDFLQMHVSEAPHQSRYANSKWSCHCVVLLNSGHPLSHSRHSYRNGPSYLSSRILWGGVLIFAVEAWPMGNTCYSYPCEGTYSRHKTVADSSTQRSVEEGYHLSVYAHNR